jgi:hypothetical protein
LGAFLPLPGGRRREGLGVDPQKNRQLRIVLRSDPAGARFNGEGVAVPKSHAEPQAGFGGYSGPQRIPSLRDRKIALRTPAGVMNRDIHN